MDVLLGVDGSTDFLKERREEEKGTNRIDWLVMGWDTRRSQ